MKVQAHSPRALIEANHVYLITLGDVLGALACWAVRQSPYTCPDNLDVVLKKASNIMKMDYRWEKIAEFYMGYFSYRALEAYLAETLEKIPEFVAWNSPKKGTHVIMFVSALDGPRDPDFDFIDLGALYNNVTALVLSEAEDFRLFNEKFDEQYGSVQPDGSNATISISSASPLVQQRLAKCREQRHAKPLQGMKS